MNIAHIASYTTAFPLTKHNGRYEWLLRLAREQVRQGHTVSVYAAPGSHDESAIHWKTLPYDFKDKTKNNIALCDAAFSNGEHDIFHSHLDYLHHFTANITAQPIVYTQHWFPTTSVAEAQRYNTAGNTIAVPITHYMAETNQQLGIRSAQVVYHGIDLSLFTPSAAPRRDRLVFVGRITPSKGVKEAIHIAKQSGEALDIAGKISEKDKSYWEEILPLIDGEQIRYLGPQPQSEVVKLFQNAKAFLFPSQQPEAFGLVTIEAQACGTPVITSSLGAAKELVRPSVTGFVCQAQEDYLSAISQLNYIRPEECRTFAESFSEQTMFKNYDTLYQSFGGSTAHA